MKILQINNYGYLKGGSEKVFFDTVSLLRQNGNEVLCLYADDSMNEASIDGYSIKIEQWSSAKKIYKKISNTFKFIYNKQSARLLEKIIINNKPDIAHIHIYYGRLSNSIINVLLKYNIPIVQSVHEYRLICPAYTCLNSKMEICQSCASSRLKIPCIKGRCIKNGYLLSAVAALECFIRDLFFNNIQKFSRFIMVSDFIRKEHIKCFPEIEKKADLLYNSINLALYSRYRTDNKENYILYIGRLSKEKGIMTLIDSIRQTPDRYLKIAGTGPMKDEILSKLKESGLKSISLLGYVSGVNLYRLIAKAKFVVVPSEWYENNPLSIIESFALGTPVIASNIGGIPELVHDKITGYLHSPKNSTELCDCINEGLSLPDDEYKSMVSNCIRFAENKFDSNKYYESLMSIYRSILN